MKFQDGETFTLNNVRYHIQERLGRGAVSDVYLALLDGADDARVVVKVVRDDAAADFLKVEALQCEADTLNTLNRAEDSQWDTRADARTRYRRAQQTELQRRVIAVLDVGEHAPGQPVVVQEIAPQVFERFSIELPADEARMLKIAQAALDVVALAHHNGLSLKDFEPVTKGDRFRLQWLDAERQTFALKVIDWNITGGPDAMLQDLFYFGGHLYYWLTGRHVHVDSEGRTPANLGMGNPAWGKLTSGTRQLISKLLHRDSQRRYASVDTLIVDLAWWNEVLGQIETASVFRRLDDRLWQARPAGRYDRVMAIADLALYLNPPADARKSFEQSLKQARDELDKKNWQPIANALVTLGTRAYEKAALELAQQIKILSPESEAVRLANIYKLFASVGGLLKRHYQGLDERTSSEWEALETRAIPALVQRRWAVAQSSLAEVARVQPELRRWPIFNDLGEWAASGVRYKREIDAALKDAENRADPVSDSWLQLECEKIQTHQQAFKGLELVQQKAPFEPEFKERLEIESALLEAREKFYDLYTRSDELLQQAKLDQVRARRADAACEYAQAAPIYESAVQKLKTAQGFFGQVLDKDAAQRRAQIFERRVQTALEQMQLLQSQAVALYQARQDLVATRYEPALAQVNQVLLLAPGRKDALDLQAEVQRQQQSSLLELARNHISAGKYAEARPYVSQVVDLARDCHNAQEMLAEVERGGWLVQQVRVYLQGAKTYLDNDEFEKALKQLQRFDGWDGRPLRDLPGGEVSPAVGARPFRMLAKLRERTGNLRQQIEVTHDAQENVDKAWKENHFIEVVSLCEALKRHYPQMTPELTQRYEDAKQRLKSRDAALAKITQAEGFDDLRVAMRLITADLSAEKPRMQAAQEWLRRTREMARQINAENDWQSLLSRIQDGQSISASFADAFKGMYSLAKRAHDLATEPISLAADSSPAWLTYPDWLAWLARVEEDLAAVLAESQGWPLLQQLMIPWRGRLHQHLEAFLQDKFKELDEQYPQKHVLLREIWSLWGSMPVLARNGLPKSLLEGELQKQLGALRSMARQKDFEAASMGIEALWGGVPEAIRNQLLNGVYLEARDFRAQLVIRCKVDQEVSTVVQRLASDPTYGFQDAYEVVKAISLPGHIDVSGDDVEALRSDLKQASLIEKLASLVPVPDLNPEPDQYNYVQLLRKCREEVLALSSLSEKPALTGRVRGLRELLPNKRDTLARMLEAALAKAVGEQIKRLDADPHLVADLYQQAWWCQSIELRNNPSPAMTRAQKLPRVILKKAGEFLTSVCNLVDFAEPEKLIERAEKLNNDLLTYKSEFFPSLPGKVALAEAGEKWQLDAGSMTQLRVAVTDLKKHLQTVSSMVVQAVPASATEPLLVTGADAVVTDLYDGKNVSVVASLATELKKVLEQLHGAWRALGLDDWSETDNLAVLKAELSYHEVLAEHCTEAFRLLQNKEVMAGLQLLAQHVAAEHLDEKLETAKLPLLANPRQLLLLNYAALRQGLIAALSGQIAKIFIARNADEELRSEVLSVARFTDLGEAAYDAILQGVTLRAQQAQAEGRQDEALRLWKVVIDATAPWADPALDEAKLTAISGEQKPSKRRGKQRKQGTSPPAAPQRRSSQPTSKQSSGSVSTRPNCER